MILCLVAMNESFYLVTDGKKQPRHTAVL